MLRAICTGSNVAMNILFLFLNYVSLKSQVEPWLNDREVFGMS